MTQSQEISKVFDYPFGLSSIKKLNNETNLLGQQTTYKLSFQQPTIQTSHQKQHQRTYRRQLGEQNEPNLNDQSSIEFQDGEEYEEENQQEIQFLQQTIVQKLSQQFSFIKEKLKQKYQQKQNLLKYFRQISTYRPQAQNTLNLTNKISMADHRKKTENPLNTKKIKNRIVKKFPQQKVILTQNEQKILNQVQRNNLNYLQFNPKFQGQRNIYINNIKVQNFKVQRQTPSFSKQNHLQKVIFQTNNDQFRLIQQISDELKKMQFKKIEDIAQGKFHFSKKK